MSAAPEGDADRGRYVFQDLFLAFVAGMAAGTVWTSYLLLWAK